MGRPRTLNAKIKDLPRGMRKVGNYWYWRGTDHATQEVAEALKARGVSMQCGDTPIKARVWWEKNVSPMLRALEPITTVEGTVEELLRLYESKELVQISNLKTREGYQANINALRAWCGARRYAKSEADAMQPDVLKAHECNQYLADNAQRANAASKEISRLGRVFRLARVRWGKTTYNPVDGVEYPSAPPRDAYIDDATFIKMREIANPVLRCMMDIASQTGARRGMILDIRVGDIQADHLVVRVSKKKTRSGFEEVLYVMTPDLRTALDEALALRRAVPGCKNLQPSDNLFATRNGLPYTGESFKRLWKSMRDKLGLMSWEFTFHDIRAKAASDSDSDQDAQKLLVHADANITRRVYRRKSKVINPLSAVSSNGRSASI